MVHGNYLKILPECRLHLKKFRGHTSGPPGTARLWGARFGHHWFTTPTAHFSKSLCSIFFFPGESPDLYWVLQFGRCLFFTNNIISHLFEVGNCIRNSIFDWMKNTHKQLSITRFKYSLWEVTIYYREVYNRHLGATQQTQNICITFVQCWTNVEDIGTTLFKCYTSDLCLLPKVSIN